MTIPYAEGERLRAALSELDLDVKAMRAFTEALRESTTSLESMLPLSEARIAALRAMILEQQEPPPPPPNKWIGGPPGRTLPDGTIEEVIPDQVITAPIPTKTRNRCYLNCTFDWQGINKFVTTGEYWNLRLLRCTVRNARAVTGLEHNAPKIFYVHNISDPGETDCGIVIQDLTLENSRTEFLAEFKASGVTVADVRYIGDTNISRQDIVLRHGQRNLVMRCPNFDYLTVRGADHYIFDCVKAHVQLLAGNMPGRRFNTNPAGWSAWSIPGGMNNQHTSERCFISGVRLVEVGPLNKEILSPGKGLPAQLHPCRDHFIDPNIPDAAIKYISNNHVNIVREARQPDWLTARLADVTAV